MPNLKNPAPPAKRAPPNRANRGANNAPPDHGGARGETIVCGFHAIAALLRPRARPAGDLLELWLDEHRRDTRIAELARAAAAAGVRCRRVPRAELQRAAGGVKHQGVLARMRNPKPPADLARYVEQIPSPKLILLLDGVQDPHNLGAILRVAGAAGAAAVVLPKVGACPINAAVRRAAVGAAELVPVFYVANLARTMRALRRRGLWIIGADAAADRDVAEMDFHTDIAIALGGEGRGLRRLTRAHCDQVARIPLRGVASLNVAVAAGIFLYEARRGISP